MRKIAYKFFLGFGIILSFTLAIVIIIYMRSSQLQEIGIRFVGHDLPELVLLNEVKMAIVEQDNALHLYLVTGQNSYLDEFIEREETGRRLLSMHKALNIDDVATEYQMLTNIWNAYDVFHEMGMESVDLYRKKHRVEANMLASTAVHKAKDELLRYCQELMSLEDLEVRKNAGKITASVDSARHFVMGMSAMMLGLAGILSFVITRSITRPLEKLVDTMQKASSGDLTVRSGISEVDEVGFLAKSFDQMIAELEKTFSAQKQFINDASHDLRTPITIIKGHLEILGRFGQPTYEDFTETKALLLDELDRMSRMVSDLLLLARSEEPEFFNMREVDLKEFLDTIFRKASSMSAHNWALGEVPKVKIEGDPHRLTQVFLNLMDNAIFHTPPEGYIRLSAEADSEWVRISVADTGVGIPEEDLERVFQRFYRVDKARSREHGGMGLGLAIVESIVKGHKGRITVSSELGRGSVFTVWLPVLAAVPSA